MKYKILIMLIGIVQISNAQKFNYFESYYPSIYRAERMVLDSNYNDALKIYESAFLLSPFSFGRDYYNTLVCAVLSNNTNAAFSLLEKLTTQGASIEWLSRQAILKPLLNTAEWSRFRQKYPTYRKQFERNFNTALKKELIGLDSLDQTIRKKEDAYNLYMDAIDSLDFKNATRLNEIIKLYGFPGERVIGIRDSIGAGTDGDLVLIHQASTILRYKSPIDFDNLIEQAKYGYFSPHTAAYLLDSKNNEVPFFMYTSVGLCKAIQSDPTTLNSVEDKANDEENLRKAALVKFAYLNRQGKSLENFDAMRKNIGLEPSDEFRKKVFIGQQKSHFLFNYMGAVLTFEFNNEVDMKNFMQPLVEFKLN